MKKIKPLIIVLFVLVFILVGYKEVNKLIARNQVVVFLNGYKQRDETISQLLLGSPEAYKMSFGEVSTYFADKLEYKIISCRKEKGNIYNVEVEVQTIDFERLFFSSYQETIEKHGEEGIAENFLSEMGQNIEEEENDTHQVICNVVVRKMEDGFKIQMDSSFANALTGGMNEYLSSLQGGE